TAPSANLVVTSFGLQNQPKANTDGAGNASYDWLVHLDRALISPMELLHVSGYQPYQLTHYFINPSKNILSPRFQHRVDWYNQALRLYRVFEWLETNSRAAGVGIHGRLPGRMNINTMDRVVFQALCDAQGIPGGPNYFSTVDVDTIYNTRIAPRIAPNPTGLPFRAMSSGFTNPGQQYPVTGSGINNTFLSTAGGAPTFQVGSAPHPYLQ